MKGERRTRSRVWWSLFALVIAVTTVGAARSRHIRISVTSGERPARVTAGPSTSPAAPSLRQTGPAAQSSAPPPRTVATVGPLFADGSSSSHGCTASVVDSPAGDLLLTAAHCVSGTGAGMTFAPGYDGGTAPYGSWPVVGAYAPQAWLDNQDPQSDYAFLVVGRSHGRTLQDVVGANVISVAPAAGDRVTLVGYVRGSGDDPVICTGSVYSTTGYPAVDCRGYAPGTSGSPWLEDVDPNTGRGIVTAVIGGLHAGGCDADTSYSSSFDSETVRLYARAEMGGTSDSLPSPPPDGC